MPARWTGRAGPYSARMGGLRRVLTGGRVPQAPPALADAGAPAAGAAAAPAEGTLPPIVLPPIRDVLAFFDALPKLPALPPAPALPPLPAWALTGNGVGPAGSSPAGQARPVALARGVGLRARPTGPCIHTQPFLTDAVRAYMRRNLDGLLRQKYGRIWPGAARDINSCTHAHQGSKIYHASTPASKHSQGSHCGSLQGPLCSAAAAWSRAQSQPTMAALLATAC